MIPTKEDIDGAEVEWTQAPHKRETMNQEKIKELWTEELYLKESGYLDAGHFEHTAEYDTKKLASFISNLLLQERSRIKNEVESMRKYIFKWDYKEGDGETKEAFNSALDDVLKIIG